MSKERILLLEEEPNALWTEKALLEGEEFQVIAAASLDRAFQSLKEGEIGGLITEYRINQSSTLPLIREFKKAFPAAYVMMLSYREIQEGEYKDSITAGVDDVFQKPIPFGKFLLHLEKGLSHRRELLRKKELEEELKKLSPKVSTREETPIPNVHQFP
jgi:DNA-binding NtrC family response regulator